MRDLGSLLRALAVFCAAGPVVAFLPSFSPARARSGRSVGVPCARGLAFRRDSSRAIVSRSSLNAAEDGHMLPEDQQSSLERPNKLRSRWSKGQGSWSKASNDAPVEQAGGNAVASGDTPRSRWSKGQGSWSRSSDNAPIEQAGGDVVGPGDEGLGQSMAAAAEAVEGAAAVTENDAMMADMGPAGGVEEVDETPKINVTKKRLKKFYLKDFEGSSWTVAIQWKNRPYRIETTKVALKEDGSVVWLNKAKGSWRLRTKTRDLVFYRDFFLGWNGKRIFAAKLLDNTCNIYLEGEIKGWAPFVSLDTLGYFQAVRRGIVVDENTPRPPWESRPFPEPDVIDGKKRGATGKEILVKVDLD